ncbi:MULTISPECIES: hypothetical protein [Mesonia]|uniref:Uncharacterized protein n=1 Tax=Mesonia oceanica TaxID=2687242 RepID=A0AC61YDF6_9FLAO|nr:MULTISPECIES: hypothetical protein [Mesonia]MAN28093.1 hypothetical protein [Mesonia sp.]MAQ39789.1 hypothetical protein [Mesonia sp.]MBJ98877.1 hypothetical protein [Flavobacteriaceae bacterium]VVV02496.1 hypothetical protein FVB9532_03795 [Mesonia oceanica]|tara:strand:+ start:1161 stop:1535 length:375 start_codon:yes stop_codon:yes gene_type:complete
MPRNCPVCGEKIKGRSDKRFCSPTCKSSFHYDRRLENENLYHQVDRQLKLNRKILKSINRKGYSTVNKKDLKEEGFNPNFFTHYWKNKQEDVYLFVYEYGFLDLSKKSNKAKYLVVTWQEYMGK